MLCGSRRFYLFIILFSLFFILWIEIGKKVRRWKKKIRYSTSPYFSPLESLSFISIWQKQRKKETIISKQIVRSATSIGANANEAIYGISKADFIAKLQISLKETAETEYWLRLLMLSEYITPKEGESLLADCLEIKKLLISTLNTAKENK